LNTSGCAKTVTASFVATNAYQACVGSKSQTVNPATTATTLAASKTAVVFGTPVSFTATVTATSAGAN
jgi:hypothetical protein